MSPPIAAAGVADGVVAGALADAVVADAVVAGATAGAAADAAGALAGAAGEAPAAASSSVRISEPSLTLSPTATFSVLTTPACDDGISIDALSLSIVMR